MRTCDSSPGWALRAADAILASLGSGMTSVLGVRIDQAGLDRGRRLYARIMVRERLRDVLDREEHEIAHIPGDHVCEDCGLTCSEHPVFDAHLSLVVLCDGRMANP